MRVRSFGPDPHAVLDTAPLPLPHRAERPPETLPAFRRFWQSPDPEFIPQWGRTNSGFGEKPSERARQATSLLHSFGKAPVREGELFLIQIDQDSPPPAESALRRLQFAASYSGRTALFQTKRVNGTLELVELNSKGPWASASHPGQIDPAGQASCNGKLCGLPWLRTGVYSYRGTSEGNFIRPLADPSMSVARDQNQDGVIDMAESLTSASAYGFAILFHPGLPGAPQSAGCQTMPPAAFAELRNLLAAAGQDTLSYVLLRRPNDLTGEYLW